MRATQVPNELKPSPEALERILEDMEKYAGKPPYGVRQPGERNMYEIQRREMAMSYLQGVEN